MKMKLSFGEKVRNLREDKDLNQTEVAKMLGMREKIALFCNVKKENVLQNLDADSLYEVPLMMVNDKLNLTMLCDFYEFTMSYGYFSNDIIFLKW